MVFGRFFSEAEWVRRLYSGTPSDVVGFIICMQWKFKERKGQRKEKK